MAFLWRDSLGGSIGSYLPVLIGQDTDLPNYLVLISTLNGQSS
jgi:hypothetical protein